MKFEIRRDNLSESNVQALVREHLVGMLSNSPLESVHALPLEGLRNPDVTFWSVWRDDELCGCGALKELYLWQAEAKLQDELVQMKRLETLAIA